MKKIEEMSLKEKVGQLFAVGFDGITPSRKIIDLIENEKIGAIIYFSRNVENTRQLWELSRSLQDYSEIPLFISIDQEGGLVVRITEGVTSSPGNMAIGATAEPAHSENIAEIVGKELRTLGINMNLAPCLDVNNNPNNPVIGVRSFGEDPKKVSEMGMAAIRGYRKAKIVPTIKHFPGHGDTDIDSHLDMPVVLHDMSRIENIELYPFREAIDDEVECIMISHIAFPDLEDSCIPATLSKKIVTGLLRKKLKYNGIVMTDCMEMKAILEQYDIEEAAIRAIEAGVDIVLISHTYELQKRTIDAIVKAVESGRISEERIDISVRRIMELKENLEIDRNSGDWDADKDKLTRPESLEYVRTVSEESITVVREDNFIPITQEERVLVIWTETATPTKVEEKISKNKTLGDILKKNHNRVYEVYADINPKENEIQDLVEKCSSFDRIIITSYNAANNVGQKKLIRLLNYIYGKKLAVISLRNPYDIRAFKNISNYIVSYDKRKMTLESTAKILLGRVKAKGKLTITVV